MLANRTDDRLEIGSERKGEIKDAIRIFVLSNWIDVVAVCWVQNTESTGLGAHFGGWVYSWEFALKHF